MSMFDEDEDAYNNEDRDQDEFDKVFKLVTVDRLRKVKIIVKLVDSDGDEVPLKETVHQLVDYLNDKSREHLDNPEEQKNDIVQKIMPLVTQALVAGLPRVLGPKSAALFLSVEHLRMSTIMMMLLAFSLTQFVRQKNLKIVTVEEPITEEDLAMAEKMSKLTNAATMGAMLGKNPKEILEDMVNSGDISQEDADTIIHKDKTKTIIFDDDDGEAEG